MRAVIGRNGGLVVNELGVSVVVPAYGSTDSLRILVDRVHHVLAPLGPYEIVIVDDGSLDATWQVITEITADHPEVRGIRLGRNYGQHNALIAGVRAARFPITVTIDDDLQNPPEEIPRLLGALTDGNFDVVYGLPDRVKQSGLRRLASRMNRMALRSGLGDKAATDLSSFRAFRTRVRDAFEGELGANVALDAVLTWGSDRFGSVTVRHDPRAYGVSNYSFGKLVRFAIDSTTGYSAVPLQFASFLGLATAGFGLIVLVFVVARPLLSGDSVPGFPFLAATIAIFSGAQLLTLGIFGEYLARMHFRLMRKPTYFVSEISSTDRQVP